MPWIIISLCEKSISWAFHVFIIWFSVATWNALDNHFPVREAFLMGISWNLVGKASSSMVRLYPKNLEMRYKQLENLRIEARKASFFIKKIRIKISSSFKSKDKFSILSANDTFNYPWLNTQIFICTQSIWRNFYTLISLNPFQLAIWL